MLGCFNSAMTWHIPYTFHVPIFIIFCLFPLDCWVAKTMDCPFFKFTHLLLKFKYNYSLLRIGPLVTSSSVTLQLSVRSAEGRFLARLLLFDHSFVSIYRSGAMIINKSYNYFDAKKFYPYVENNAMLLSRSLVQK